MATTSANFRFQLGLGGQNLSIHLKLTGTPAKAASFIQKYHTQLFVLSTLGYGAFSYQKLAISLASRAITLILSTIYVTNDQEKETNAKQINKLLGFVNLINAFVLANPQLYLATTLLFGVNEAIYHFSSRRVSQA